jgi:hypothetical protein
MSEEKQEFTVKVYLDNGVTFQYQVESAHKAREHSSAIVMGGYRHNDGKGEFEHYPPHRILKVKVTDGVVPTDYTDTPGGT